MYISRTIICFQIMFCLGTENKQAIATFMERARGGRVRFEAERVVMSGGATGANETIMFCLADPGDAFLVPTPYYAAYVYIHTLLVFK